MMRIFLTLFLLSNLILASDLERENRIYSQVVDAILDGELVEFFEGDHKFLGVYTETEADLVKGEILLLHTRGLHLDWEFVISPLRTGLLEHGWNTLSIQLPVLAKSALYYDYVPIFAQAGARIKQAYDYLQKKSPGKVVLIGHGCGFHMANNWFGNDAADGLLAFVGIGAGATDTGQDMVEDIHFAKIKAPILDIYAQFDYGSVRGLSALKKSLLEVSANKLSQQIEVAGTEHYYKEKSDELTELIAAWLDKVR